jgi:Bacterial Ig-like domain (group 3)/Putative Ig domain
MKPCRILLGCMLASLCLLSGGAWAQTGLPPTIAKSFGAASIPLNGSTLLTFMIENPNSDDTLTGVGFTDSLPAGLVASTPNGLTSSCSSMFSTLGTIVATAGSGSISLASETLESGDSCTFSVSVTGTTQGMKTNTVTVTSTNNGTGNTDSASITVVVPPTIAKSFGAVTMAVGESTSLSFTIDNPNKSSTLTGVGFTDPLPAGLVVSTPNGLTGSCGGGTILAAAGSGAVSLTGATLAVGASCAFSVNVTATSAGTKDNTTGPVTSVEGGTGGTASASIRVSSPPPRCVAPTITSGPFPSGVVGAPYAFTVTASGDSPLTFSISGLPPGLSFDPASGKVSGAPTAAGTSTLTITASNGCQPTAVQTQTLTVVRSLSTLSISASPNPAYFGQAVIVIARAASSPLPPLGIVFLCARETSAFCPPPFDTAPPGTPASAMRALLSAPLDATGQATFTLSGLSIDNYILKASYGGDTAHDGASAGPIDEFVIKGILLTPPKVALAAPLRASGGAPLSIGVRVTPSAPAPVPTGTVRLYAGADLVDSATLDANGSTQFRIAAAATGAFSLRADYSGDALFPPASSPESMVTIAAANPTVDIPAVGPMGLALLALVLAALGMRPLYRRARRH